MEDNTNYANVLFSDNNGESWRMGGHIPFGVDLIWRPIHSSEAMVCDSGDVHMGWHVCICPK